MSINMKSLTQAWAKTAAVIEKTVQSTVHEVTGPKALQEYELLDQIGSGGPGLAWKLFAGKSRSKSAQSHNQDVCVWLLDKKALAEARQKAGLSKAVEDAFLDIVRADATQLVKLRHPGIIHVIQGLDESKGAIAMVTEPIFASLANVLGQFDNVAKIPKELKQLELGQLEIKHGLLQLTDSLSFLHNNARLVHRSLSPETVFITSSGAWKLAGFGFALSLDQVSDMAGGGTFHYPAYDADDVFLPLQPPLNYTAPELTRNTTSASVNSSDMFSLACLAYHVLVRQPLIQSKNNIKVYMNKVTYLMNEKFEKIPPELTHDLRRMLDPDEHSRLSVLEFSSSSFFRDDTELRALRFLDHLLERDNMQKAEFLKAFTGMWTKFDARVLRYKVLPPLCAELRNVIMQPLILPMVLTIAESQEKGDFESSTFPALIPVLSSATGDSLLLLVKHAALLVNKVSPEALTTNVVPMLVRAYDDPDARMQEEVLRRTLSFAIFLDFQVLTQAILPRLHSLALRTTVAAVRLNAILCLGELVQRLDKQAVLEILQTLRRCTAVDRSAPTLMSTLGVSSAIYKQFGIEFAAEHLLPLLSPLLVTQQLNLQQFAKYMLFVKDILRKIEEKRGVTLNEIDPASVNVAFLGTNTGRSSSDGKEPVVNGEVSGAKPKHCDSWYLEDWDVIGKGQNSSGTDLSTISSVSVSAGFGNTSGTHDVSSAIPSPGTLPSFEWPLSSSLTTSAIQSVPETNEWSHPISSSITQRLGTSYHSSLQHGSSVAASSSSIYDEDNKNAESNGSSSLNFDPFADWPPRKAVTTTTGEISTNIGRLNTVSMTSGSATQPSSKPWNDDRLSVLDRSSISDSEQKSQPDLAEFFTSKKTHAEPILLKLAPPPGKGRVPIRSGKSNKTSAHKPSNKPLLDLL